MATPDATPTSPSTMASFDAASPIVLPKMEEPGAAPVALSIVASPDATLKSNTSTAATNSLLPNATKAGTTSPVMASPDATPKSNTSTAATRGWALDNANASVRIKPRRPYTPYNLFYLLERERVVQGNDPSLSTEKAKKKAIMEKERPATMGERKEDDIPLPQRYNGIVMLPMWYEPNLKEKRKHRKTHGKISFKELTGIISKNWANIDAETKDYCTRISEMGRKRYKGQITRYNASQKILQLKKEHAAMQSAKEEKLEKLQQKMNSSTTSSQSGSPPRQTKPNNKRGPTTPDRIISHQPAKIVTPTSHYSNRRSQQSYHSQASNTYAFQNYGPPPPMPLGMQNQHLPPPMPTYNQTQHQHSYNQTQYPRPYPVYSYPQAPAVTYNSGSNGYSQAMNMGQSGRAQASGQNMYGQRSRNQTAGQNMHGQSYTGKSSNSGNRHNSNLVHSGHKQTTNYYSSLPPPLPPPLNITVNSKASKSIKASQGIKRENTSSIFKTKRESKSGMSHSEALLLGNLLTTPKESPGQYNGGAHSGVLLTNDTLLQEFPSFDFADHHSLSSENDSEVEVMGATGKVEHQDECLLDLMKTDLLPLEEIGGEEFFTDLTH